MVCNLFTLLFKPPSCNGPETELKCKIGFRTYINYICILSYTDNWCIVLFCINISGYSPNRMCLLFDFRNTIIWVLNRYSSLQRLGGRGGGVWRAGYTARKFLHKLRHHKQTSIMSNAWQ